jgi:hypothetical protein
MTLKMIKKHYLTLDDEFVTYCNLNGIENIEKLAQETFKRGFTMLKYGDTVPTPTLQKKPVKPKEIPIKKEVKEREIPTIKTTKQPKINNNDLYDE